MMIIDEEIPKINDKTPKSNKTSSTTNEKKTITSSEKKNPKVTSTLPSQWVLPVPVSAGVTIKTTPSKKVLPTGTTPKAKFSSKTTSAKAVPDNDVIMLSPSKSTPTKSSNSLNVPTNSATKKNSSNNGSSSSSNSSSSTAKKRTKEEKEILRKRNIEELEEQVC